MSSRGHDGQSALRILRLEREPYVDWSSSAWERPPSAWMDYALVCELIGFGDGMSVRQLAEICGYRGQWVSGRCRALRNRGILRELRGREAERARYEERNYSDLSSGGKVYGLSAASKRRAHPRAKAKRRNP